MRTALTNVEVDLEKAKSLQDVFGIYENYHVFKDGKVYNKRNKLFLKHCINHKGVHYVSLPPPTPEKKGKNEYVHRARCPVFYPKSRHQKKCQTY
jgi:hypothetical protein